ncbi:MAG: DUF1972 domain-containing protein [Leptothrix sp. (in: b-proteobacteria)]
MKKVSIIGTVGVPASYGGFEALVENLIRHHYLNNLPEEITVYCSGKNYQEHRTHFLSARLCYIPLQANGIQSVLYDIVSLLIAIWRRQNAVLVLGVSGAIALPLVRLFSKSILITNIDGIEWRREKWRGVAKHFLRFSEKIAVRYSHKVIADNGAIASYIQNTYGIDSHVIAYGGDHAIHVDIAEVPSSIPSCGYAFAVCRIEPENNVHMVLEAFTNLPEHRLVFVGNWNRSDYGRSLRQQYAEWSHIQMLDPIYDLGVLKSLRMHAGCYIHGHSAGGTNPSLVEAMHFGIPIFAFDCDFNRNSTDDEAIYFRNSEELMNAVCHLDDSVTKESGHRMKILAKRYYTWEKIAQKYFDLIGE